MGLVAALAVAEAAEVAWGEGEEGGLLGGMALALQPQWQELVPELERLGCQRCRLLLPSLPLFQRGFLYTS